jgi:lipopolysaccharide export system protein LptC
MASRLALLRRTAIGALVALVAFVIWGIYRAGLGETPPPPSSTDIIFHNGFANGERIKTRSWTADYDRIVSNADQTVLDLDNVRNGTIFKKGKPYLRVRAAHMTVNTVTRDFSVTGALHVETVDAKPARSFDTTSADWSDSLQRLNLTKKVAIHTGAAAPLMVGSLVVNVKTGQIEMHDVSGPVRFK